MKKMIAIGAAMVALTWILIGCSHDSPSQPKEMRSGAIFSPTKAQHPWYYPAMCKHTMVTPARARSNGSVYIHTRYQLTNIFDGTRTFPGGDRVTVYFYSPSHNPYNPNPEYSGDIAFTVDGQTIVKVLGRDMYELSGN